jgi:methionyl-tRNA synthetase
MINKNCDGKVPEYGEFNTDDRQLFKDVREGLKLETIRALMDKCEFHKVLEKIIEASGRANVYIDVQAPWTLKKTNISRMNTVLYVLCEQIRKIAILLRPFVPDAASKILDQLAIPQDRRALVHIGEEALQLMPGTALPVPEGVFPRFVVKE